MSLLEGTLARLRLLFARHAADSRMAEEFRFHLEMETEKNIRAGMPPQEARRRAAIAFGGVEHHKEGMRDDRGLAWLGGWSLDLKLGLRMLAKYPGLTVVGGLGMAVATAIGVGAFAFFNSYMSPDLPFHEGERVVAIVNLDKWTRDANPRVLHDFDVWRRELGSVIDLGAFRTIHRNLITTSGRGEPVVLAEMSASGFRVARVPPLLGRTLLHDDERPGAPRVVVIGYDVWESRFERDHSVVGRTIRLGGVVHTVVGVMPRGFAFPVSHSWWVALRLDPAGYEAGRGPEVDVFGRLAPGATRDAAQAELTVVGRRIAAANPETHARLQPRVIRFTDIFTEGDGEERWEFTLLQIMIAMVLVLVCMNVAILVFARTVSRTAEIAMRTALGATRGRIVTQLFAEAFVLSVLSSLLGLGIVVVGLRYLDHVIALFSETGRAPFWLDPGISVGTMLYALALALLGAVIVGVLPALRATGAQLHSAIGTLSGGAKAQLGRTWTFLIVTQIAITVAVLPPALQKGAQLLDQAMQKPDFPAETFLAATYLIEREDDTLLPDGGLANPELVATARATQTELTARLASEPAVVGVTFADGIPGGEAEHRIEIGDDGTSARVRTARVDAGFFAAFGVKLVAGRTFDLADGALASNRPVIVNRSFVAEVFGGADVVGRRIRHKRDGDRVEPWHTIVGVVEDFPVGIREPDQTDAKMYHLAAPGELPRGRLLVRLRGTTPAVFAATLREIATAVDRTLQLRRVRPLDAVYAERGRAMLMLTVALALGVGSVVLLSAAGIYALMSFTVNQRRREIGIRAALGADARRILTGVLSRAAGQLALGVAIGLALSLVVDRLTGGDLLGGKGLALVPVIAAFMAVVGLLAAAGPARRGLRVQPTEALRGEG
jgi:putative ABC transport system permease protein